MKVTLTVAHGPHAGKSFSFGDHDNFIVGRASYAHFRLPKKDRYFSRVHFMLEINPPYCRLMDMGSRNGTFVNNEKVKTVDIHDGDLIKGGQTVIQVAISGVDAGPAGEVRPPGEERPSAANIPQPVPVSQDGETADSDSAPAPLPPDENENIQARYVQPRAGRASSSASSLGAKLSDSADGGDAGDSIDPASRRFQTVMVERIPVNVALTEAARALLPDDFTDRINNRPQPIPDYLIVDELGKGGMGVVYRAIGRSSGEVVALKTIRPAVQVSEGDIERFLREADILKGLKHPNIVAFQEMGESDGGLFFVMEYVAGSDAARLLVDNGGPLAIPTAVGIICQLLSALEYAHAEGFVHRDIKPQNMLLGRVEGRGIVKLADFGLARTYQNSRVSGLTMMGDVRGTSQYMAPEQITHFRDTKPATDQYAAAATLYHLLTDAYIFDFPDTISRKFQMILQEDPVPIGQRRDEVPDDLAEIIHRGLQRDPDERFQNVTKMREALLGVLQK